MRKSIVFIALLSLAPVGSALAQTAAPAESHPGALPQPVGTTAPQQPGGVTRTDGAERKAGNTAAGVDCQSASAEMTNGKVETCRK